MAEASDAAEDRDRRRWWRLAAADRLGRRDGERGAATGAAVPADLPVDAAAFLGARPVRALGLCRRWHPDDAGRGGCAVDAAPDSLLCAHHCRFRARALAARLYPRALSLVPRTPAERRAGDKCSVVVFLGGR